MHLHVRAELAGRHLRVALARRTQHGLVERAPLPGGCRAAEARSVAAARIGGQRELRNQQEPAGDVLHAAVHLAGLIAEDAQFGEARLKLGEVYETARDYPNAVREYIRAADLLPKNLEAQIKAKQAAWNDRLKTLPKGEEFQKLGERLKAVEARPAVVNTTTVVAEKATDQARLDEAVGEDLAVDTEDAADMADEADHPDAEQDEALFLKLASSMAPLIAQAVVEALTPQLGEVKAAMDVDKKMAAHIADLKSTLGTMTAQKDATIAELKGAVAELRGEQPLAAQVPRPSQDPATRLPPELAAAIKGFAPTTDEPPASTDVISSFLGAFKGFGTT